jgi:hypothetical protein
MAEVFRQAGSSENLSGLVKVVHTRVPGVGETNALRNGGELQHHSGPPLVRSICFRKSSCLLRDKAVSRSQNCTNASVIPRMCADERLPVRGHSRVIQSPAQNPAMDAPKA